MPAPRPADVLRAAVDCSSKARANRCALPPNDFAVDSLTFGDDVGPSRLPVRAAGQARCFTSGSPAPIHAHDPGMKQISGNDPYRDPA